MKRAGLFRWIIASVIVLATIMAVAVFYLRRSIAAPATPTPAVAGQSDESQQIERVIRAAVDAEVQTLAVGILFETRIEDISISSDGKWATAWLTPVDPDTNEVVPSEPGLALVQRGFFGWKATLPSDPSWTDLIQQAPDDLVSPEQKQSWMKETELQALALAPSAPLSGYKLPFPGGDTRRLTQSLAHDRYTPSGNAHYSFDFATAYPSAMFQVVAAKSGIVSRVRWTQANGSPADPGNYIVLEDTSTIPTTYQLYLHLAQDSIPAELRVVGTPVLRGQYLGMADDTGVSTGHHLHFMVHTTTTSYWGRSVDIVFEEVAINGGRPRIASDLSFCESEDVCAATQVDYLSTNYLHPDPTPPIGNITSPTTGASVAGPTVQLEGWALDDSSGMFSARFMADFNGSWQPVSANISGNALSAVWDMCAANVPDGPISLALELRDKAFNQTPGLPGLTHFIKNYACPATPKCSPASNEVALYSEADFGGQCIELPVGSYNSASSLGAVGDNNVVSIKVGSSVKATLFSDANKQGRAETFIASDLNLADNRLAPKITSSVLVQTRTTAPAVPIAIWPSAGYTSPSNAALNLSWQDAGGGTEFQATILLNTATVQTSPWTSDLTWQPGALSPGTYTWKVKARSGALESAWSTAQTLVVGSASIPPSGATISPPFEDSIEVERGWTGTEGWKLSSAANHSTAGQLSWQYAPGGSTYSSSTANAGMLVSPPISIPAAGVHYLRFWYLYQTESGNPFWDQRWIQISANGGPWNNLLQLQDDPANYWLRSPAISLQAYANQTIRIRFYFATLDANLNDYSGWFIDDFSITTAPPPACSDGDNTPAQAGAIAYGGSAAAVICPGGDVDYHRFRGSAGDKIGAWTEAQNLGSPLDTRLTLLDGDGRTLLSANDDMVQFERIDSWITYQLPHDGDYYLKVQAWDQPTSGDPTFTYKLNLVRDHQIPQGLFSSPLANAPVALDRFILTVLAADDIGISHVVFQAHSSDWLGGGWTTLGEDWNGADGWSFTPNATQLNSLLYGAVFARIYDWGGNSVGIGVWDVHPPGVFLPYIIK